MPGLIRGVARTAVVAGTASTVAGRVNRRQQNKWARQDAEQQAAAAPPQAVPQQAAPPAADPIEQLKELGELHQSGVLTDEEFAVQKAKILNG
jgi:hypothetical protein